MTSFEPLQTLFPETPSTRTVSTASPVPEEPIPSSRLSKISTDQQPLLALVYDKEIGENIYPVDELLRSQLENVNYFVKLPSR